MNVPVADLMRVVSAALTRYAGHREYEDLYSEALVAAWQAVRSRQWGSWSAIAWKAACWQAADYLRKGRSGKLGGRYSPPQYAAWIAELQPDQEPATDGGIGAADARLQIWLNERREGCRVCHAPVKQGMAGTPRRFYCSKRCYRLYWQRKYRERRRRATCCLV